MFADILTLLWRTFFVFIFFQLLSVTIYASSKKVQAFHKKHPRIETITSSIFIVFALAVSTIAMVDERRQRKEWEEFCATEEGKRYLEEREREWERWSDSLDREVLKDDLGTFFKKQKIEISDDDLSEITDIAHNARKKAEEETK